MEVGVIWTRDIFNMNDCGINSEPHESGGWVLLASESVLVCDKVGECEINLNNIAIFLGYTLIHNISDYMNHIYKCLI